MTLSKQLTIAAGMALAISLPVSRPALSAPAIEAPSIKHESLLQRGDLVRLRSGGPLMTVDAIKGDQIECVWTDVNGQPDDASFPATMLQKF